jgi:HlyD family secretion protein
MIRHSLRPAASAALLLLALLGCAKKSPPAAPEVAVTVTVDKVARRPLKGALTATGTLVVRQEAGVASELAGYRITDVYVDEDAWVSKGQPLVKLDDSLLRSVIAQQQANLAQQEVSEQRAQAESDRVKGLDNAGVISNEQISERRLAAKAAKAQVAVAKAQLQDLKTREASLIIRAPAAGRVLERTARPGDTSAVAATLFRIAVDGLIEFDAEVSQADLGQIRVGEPVEVDLPSGAKVEGKVRFISPRVDSQTGLGHVRVALPVREDLRPGGFARAIFQPRDRPVPTVPESAVHFDANGASVMVVDDAERVHRVAVRTGARAGGFVELVEGPPLGSRVALAGGAFVLDGDKVNVASSAQGAGART